jgi:hypothetical protein
MRRFLLLAHEMASAGINVIPNLYWYRLEDLRHLGENLPAHIPVVLTGLSRADRIGTCVQIFGGRLIVISQNAYRYAMHGAVMTAGGRQDIHARAADAFAATVRYMAGLLPDRPDDR